MAEMDTQEFRDQYDALRKQFQQLYAQRAPVLKEYEKMVNATLDDLLGQTAPAARETFRQAVGMGDFYENDVMPAMGRYLSDAENYDTADRRASERGRAMTDVRVAGDASRDAALQRLESYGIDPSVTRSAALDQNMRLDTALAQVKAGTDAERAVEERGYALRRDAIGLGNTVLAGQNALLNTGTGMLDTGMRGASGVAAQWADIYGTPGENLGAQSGLVTNKVNAKNAEVATKNAADKDGATAAGIGSIAGTLGGAALGYFATGGTPMGALQGAKLGQEVGGKAGASAGGFY